MLSFIFRLARFHDPVSGRISRVMRLLLLIVVLTLSGCRLLTIDMGGASVAAPEPTSSAPIEPITTSNQEALYNIAWDDDSNVVLTLAYPHLIFSHDGVQIEGFNQQPFTENYVIYDAGYGFRQRMDWDAFWYADVYGVGSLTIDVYVQPPGADDYSQWESVSTGEFEGWGADFRNERLDVTVYFSQTGQYRVRAETYLSARIDGQAPVEIQTSFDTNVTVLSKPPSESLRQTPQDAQPFIGELEHDGVFMDWRAWSFGPCTLTSDDESFTRAVDAACQAVETGDLVSSADALQSALDYTDDLWQMATIRDQMGLIAAVLGRWNIAARHFGEARDLWESLDNATAVSRSLHNLGNALIQGERWVEGEIALQLCGGLRSHIEDWMGSALTWGQLGVYWQSYDMIAGNAQSLSDYGLPQADWLWAQLDNL